MKIEHEHIFFNSNELALECVLSYPEGVSSCPGVVVCHPHPLYGGDMNNNVVLGIKSAFQAEDLVILRFNFRGVNLSEGKYDEGEGEINDVIAAVNFLKIQKLVDPTRLFLVGYSFGAWIGLRAAFKIDNLKAIAGIAPPFGIYDFKFLERITLPIFLMCGDIDTICNKNELETTFDKISSSKKKTIVSGADHFFGGREGEVGEEIIKFFKPYFD